MIGHDCKRHLLHVDVIRIRRPPPRISLLNDDGDDVGRVHLGVVFIATLTSPLIHIRETHKLAGSLVPVSEALRRRDELEGWSARLIDTIAKVAASL